MNASQQVAVFSAARIAQLMVDVPEHAILPTPEQATVIEQPLSGTVLVIAGAGSGKTETMANRVVWLVANGFVSPSQILGLTFTRKAAGELGERIIQRLQRFALQLGLKQVTDELSPQELQRATAFRQLMAEALELPEVSTYNAFATSVVQEFGSLAGFSVGASVMDASTAWGMVRKIVCASDDEQLTKSTDSIDTIVKQVLTLDHSVSENLTTLDEVLNQVAKLERISSLPYNDKKSEGEYADITKILENMKATRLAVKLSRRFAEEKQRRGLIEFSDQLAAAVDTVQKFPEAIRILRRRTPVVLLDEVQDTSVAQTKLLSMLYRGCAVMAVGDPHQSIYGFRGASASNLQGFHRDFTSTDSDNHSNEKNDADTKNHADTKRDADTLSDTITQASERTKRAYKKSSKPSGVTLSLSTSWRNPSVVLEAANIVSTPLAAKLAAESQDISVKPLTSSAQYLGQNENVDYTELETIVSETIAQEFDSAARWMRDAQNEHLARTSEKPTAAVIFRSRTRMSQMSEALWAAGVPNRIVGIGGLLTTPEITDLVCALRCIWFADASSELLRILAGPRFRIGVADLRGLQQAARWFSKRDHTKQKLSVEVIEATPPLSDPERTYTLLDALDEISFLRTLDHAALSEISEIGRNRLREAGQLFRELRQSVGGDIPALIRSTVQMLNLDIELDASEHSGYEGSAAARANLDLFTELVEDFLATDEHATFASVLNWLERATVDDEAAEHVPEPEAGTVQLITAHGSKGLEWDLVVVPRLVEGEFPSSPREGMGWLRPGQLPDDLRGDSAARPKLSLDADVTQKEVLESVKIYQQKLKDRHAEEERRLAYVAMTRTVSRLLLTGSFWGAQQKPRDPAPYLHELEHHKTIEPFQVSSSHDTNPTQLTPRTRLWPLDPLGNRASIVLTAAAALNQHLEKSELSASAHSRPLHPVVELLLAERQAQSAESERMLSKTDQGSERITASTFHEFIEDPVNAERRRLRPIPARPYRRTRTGNLFHEWVERRVSTPTGTAVPLDFSGFEVAIDGQPKPDVEAQPTEELDFLIEQFEQSRWADLQPIAVELEISIPFAGRTLVCKLDAVYEAPSSDEPSESGDVQYEIVDWKSGKPPATAKEKASRFLQLELYRHAYALHASIDPTHIEATLFYVAEGKELRSQSPRDLEELEQLWLDAQNSLIS